MNPEKVASKASPVEVRNWITTEFIASSAFINSMAASMAC